jgi:selenocysteine-specific elongation factor
MYVVGTAGHIDHGKSTLVHALTGIDPDRLQEEKEREMTLDLGFAWLELPSKTKISIIDVPGHEKFIKNMIAGIGGIDSVVLVISAEESVMPQTYEHLAIIDLLGIPTGIIAITKSDLVDDEWINLITEDISTVVDGTILANSPIISVSSKTKQGLDTLLEMIDSSLNQIPEKRNLSRPRLAIDRSFTMTGFGTVVTGTLIEGNLSVGQDIQILPTNLTAKIRGIQTHKEVVEQGKPGQRVAINLSGIHHKQINRGHVLTSFGWLTTTSNIDVELQSAKFSKSSIKHNSGIIFHSGTSEATGRIKLYNSKFLPSGETGIAQIHLNKPLALVNGDRFIIRSSESTIGGGQIIDSKPDAHVRKNKNSLERLNILSQGSIIEKIINELNFNETLDLNTISKQLEIPENDLVDIIENLTNERRIIAIRVPGEKDVFLNNDNWNKIITNTNKLLSKYHLANPLKPGIPKEEFKQRLSIRGTHYKNILSRLVSESIIKEENATIRQVNHQAKPTKDQEILISSYLNYLSSNRFSPPTDKQLDAELLNFLTEMAIIVKTGENIFFPKSHLKKATDAIIEHLEIHGSVSIAQVRDLLNTSRKYALSILEHLDKQQITRRKDDERILIKTK